MSTETGADYRPNLPCFRLSAFTLTHFLVTIGCDHPVSFTRGPFVFQNIALDGSGHFRSIYRLFC